MTLPTPVHYWNFDQTSTGTAIDSIGGLQAVVESSGGPWSVPGKWNKAMRFGTSGARRVKLQKADGTTAPDLSTPWTAAVWIMRHAGAERGASLLYSKRSAIKIEQWDQGGQLGITSIDLVGGDPFVDKVLPLDTWSHLAVVGTPNQTLFYVDGVFVGSVASSTSLGRWFLGSTEGYVEYLAATIEELRIYDQALTPEQVAELAKLVPGKPVDPLPPPSTSALEKLPLDSVIDALNANLARISDLIPFAWSMTYDISMDRTAISDGGTDMFDFGNMLATDIDTLVYTPDNIVGRHAAVGPRGSYFTLMGRVVFISVVELDGVQRFGTRGKLGADGGSVDGTVLTTTVEGVRFRGFVKRVYGTTDPAVNHLFIVRDDPDHVSHAFPSDTSSDEHTLTGLPASGRVYYLMFGSRYRTTGYAVPYDKFQAIMNAFLTILNERATSP